MFTRSQKRLFGLAFLCLAAVPLWILFAAPQLTKLPADFSYKADIISLDNLYDEKTGKFSGEQRSITKFSYEANGEKDGVLTIKNTFEADKVTGEKIFAVERLYGIDPYTGKHVAGFGDETRDGYLFAPRHLQKGEPYTYWHVNYDGPAHMIFVGEETIGDLPVYHYETRYAGVKIDQTKNLLSLPHIGVTEGIELEPHLQVWIEPVSGHMVKYRDETTAHCYDLASGQRLHPWNTFSNNFTPESIAQQVQAARREKIRLIFIEIIIPSLLAFASLLCLGFLCLRSRTFMRILLSIVMLALLGWLGAWLNARFGQPAVYPGPPATVRVGAGTSVDTALFWIAEHNGYFAQEGIQPEITPFSSGRTALQEMLSKKTIDVVTVGQTPIVLNSFDHHDFRIIAGIANSSNDTKILARRDSGIHAPSDLKGKKIGTTVGATAHYFLGLFLSQHDLTLKDVTVVDLEPSAMPKALADGDVDAISTTSAAIFNAQKILGDTAFLLESNGIFRTELHLVGQAQWIEHEPDVVERFLRAIDKAQLFLGEHRDQSIAIVAERTKVDPVFLASIWHDFSFGLFLDQAVLLSFEHQARWMMVNDLTRKSVPSNYLDFIYFDALEAVKPEAMTIIQ